MMPVLCRKFENLLENSGRGQDGTLRLVPTSPEADPWFGTGPHPAGAAGFWHSPRGVLSPGLAQLSRAFALSVDCP